eukprot:9724564-Prorocentrum_lima.AAC.1
MFPSILIRVSCHTAPKHLKGDDRPVQPGSTYSKIGVLVYSQGSGFKDSLMSGIIRAPFDNINKHPDLI